MIISATITYEKKKKSYLQNFKGIIFLQAHAYYWFILSNIEPFSLHRARNYILLFWCLGAWAGKIKEQIYMQKLFFNEKTAFSRNALKYFWNFLTSVCFLR